MGERFSHAEQLEHLVQMRLGIFSAKGVVPLEFKPAYSVGDPLTQHLDDLEEVANNKGWRHADTRRSLREGVWVNLSVRLAA
jgi:hypothetical protein